MIICSIGCMYQTDGVCMLDRATSAGTAAYDNGCIHYVPRTEIPNAVKMTDEKK